MSCIELDGGKNIAAVEIRSPGIDDDKLFTTAPNGNILDNGLQRGLKSRHITMISFGGVVGASIWYGVDFAVAYSGPEKCPHSFPVQGAFLELAGRFVDESLAFSLGWNYWYLWVTNIAADFNASSIIMSYWTTSVPTYGWILIWWAFHQCTSLLGVVWGEMEFYLACWKLMCIFGGFLCAILINTGAVSDIGLNLDPSLNGIDGFGQCFLLAAVYYCVTEMLALTAAERKNPGRDLPKAIKQTFWRVLIIFMGLVFFAGIIVPSNDPSLLTAESKSEKSPCTFARAGVPAMGHVVNVVMITVQLSFMNSALYAASRSLLSLASSGRASAIFARTTSNETPVYALVFSNALGLIAMLNYTAGPGKVFTYVTNISGSATYIAWACIGVVHLRFRRAWEVQGHTVEELPFKAWLYPYGTIFVISF